MRQPLTRPTGVGAAFLWDLLTFERQIASSVIHLIYWSGLGLIVLATFGAIGMAIGVALREDNVFLGILLAIPMLAGGLLMTAILVLLWRAFCEFYVTIFRISEDLAALRQDAEADGRIQKRG
jgi:Domain of unknown function (DUF4282)